MNSVPNLLVAVMGSAVIVKIIGRANFTTSVSFKHLVGELWQRGFDTFLLDLSECVTMDSTFLGVLAGTALRLRPNASLALENGAQPHLPATDRLRLLNPSSRVMDLLENLGVSDLFQTVHQDQATPSGCCTPVEEEQPTHRELSETCLEAHRLLMELNPANIPQFKDVAQFLAEDLRNLGSERPIEAPRECPADLAVQTK